MKLRGIFGLALLTLFMASPAFAQGVHGVFTVVKGDIQVESGKDKKTQKARIGAKVFASDTIISGKDSRAKIEMSDKNIINISPDSKMIIEKYETGAGKKEVLLNVLQGKVRPSVSQKYEGENEKFHVKTPSAVAGVRGTDFMVSYNPGTRASQVVTFEGKVDVGSKIDVGGKIMNPVSVLPGQFTTSSGSQPPAPPAPVPTEQLKQMNRDTAADSSGSGPAAPAGGANSSGGSDKKADDGGKDQKADSKGDAKPDSKGEAKQDPKADAKPDAKGDAKADAKGGSDKGPGGRAPANAGNSMAPKASDMNNTDKSTGEAPRMPAGLPQMPTGITQIPGNNGPSLNLQDPLQNNANSNITIRITRPAGQ